MRPALASLDRLVAWLLRWGVVASLAGCFIFLAWGVVGRIFISLNLSGSHEVVEILFAWGTFLGAAMLWRERALLRVDFVLLMAPATLSWLLQILIEIGMMIFAVLMVYYGWDLATGIVEYTPFLQANKIYWYLSIPVCGTIMAVYSLVSIYDLLRHPFDARRALGKQQEIS